MWSAFHKYKMSMLHRAQGTHLFPRPSSASASSRLFRILNMIAKYRMQTSYSVLAGDPAMGDPNGDASVHPVPQRTYQVVVAATHKMGIGKDGKLPWNLRSDLKFFKELTMSTSDPGKKNAVVMGRKTWENIPLKHRPLPGRLNVVLTRSGSLDIATIENVVVCGSMLSALKLLAESPHCLSIEKVFVIGGGQVLMEAMNAPGCNAIHITKIETSFECDTFIPTIDTSSFHPWYSSAPLLENNILYSFVTYVRVRSSALESFALSSGVNFNGASVPNKLEIQSFTFLPKMILERHDEFMYIRLLQEIISSGTHKADRAGTCSVSKFGCQMRFNLRLSFPLLTTKRVFWRGVVEELLWFFSGSTNAKVLREKGIDIWDGNASRDYLDSIGLTDREEGDLGPIYGFQWRHFGARYTDMHADYTDQGFDQLLDVIDKIKNKPDERHIVLSSWNPSDRKLMAHPPCHMFAQFSVANGELSCQMYQSTADMVLGIVPGDFIHIIGDAHIYKTHIRPLEDQLQYLPKPFPVSIASERGTKLNWIISDMLKILKINPQKKDIESFVATDFELIGYNSDQWIETEMSV